MKLMYGSVPVKSMNIHSYELSTNDCTAIPSDLQAGVTCVAKGKKITGTGKSFAFATYGRWKTNESDIIPTVINVIQVGSTDYSLRMTIPVGVMHSYDFTVPQKIAEVTIDGEVYPITADVQSGELSISCEKTINLELFIGKDEYV